MASRQAIEMASYQATPSPQDVLAKNHQGPPKRWPGFELNRCQDKARELMERLGYDEDDVSEVLAALKLTDVHDPGGTYTLHGMKSSPK